MNMCISFETLNISQKVEKVQKYRLPVGVDNSLQSSLCKFGMENTPALSVTKRKRKDSTLMFRQPLVAGEQYQ